ncbi:MAG: hypothetical protein JWN40_3180 [Phycisphaerales bacterium]|nr:hypothetical protein [Phycisphaerales bacterium]
MLLRQIPLIYRRRAGVAKPRKAPPAPPPVALTLVSAAYDQDAGTVTLAFDRAIDAAGFQGAQIALADGVFSGGTYEGAVGAPTIVNPTTISIALEEIGPAPLPSVTLSATALTGIVAVDDGGTWAGATNLVLPFP